MPDFISGLISAGSSILGSVLQNDASAKQASDAQNFAAQEYNTRYQNQVKDMQAAGLNPMLSYSQSPGSSPGGVTAPVQNVLGGAADAYSSAMHGNQAGAAAEQLGAQTDFTRASTDKTNADTAVSNAQANNIAADTTLKLMSQGLVTSNIRQANASAGQAESMVGLIGSQRDLITSQISNLGLQGDFINQQIRNLVVQSRNVDQDTLLKQAQELAAKASAGLSSAQAIQLRTLLPQLVQLNAADLSLKNQSFQQGGFLTPGLSNQANFDTSSWGKLQPYIDSVSGIVNTLSSAIQAGAAATRPSFVPPVGNGPISSRMRR